MVTRPSCARKAGLDFSEENLRESNRGWLPHTYQTLLNLVACSASTTSLELSTAYDYKFKGKYSGCYRTTATFSEMSSLSWQVTQHNGPHIPSHHSMVKIQDSQEAAYCFLLHTSNSLEYPCMFDYWFSKRKNPFHNDLCLAYLLIFRGNPHNVPLWFFSLKCCEWGLSKDVQQSQKDLANNYKWKGNMLQCP